MNRFVFRNIWNLNNSHFLSSFQGPVTILRRNADEIMQSDPRKVAENRANFLLIEFVKGRYPYLLTEETQKTLEQYLVLSSKL